MWLPFGVFPGAMALLAGAAWRQFCREDRSAGSVRIRTSLAATATSLLTWLTLQSICGDLGLLGSGERVDGFVPFPDRAFQIPFVPGRWLVTALWEPRYRLFCQLCVEDVVSVSFWITVLAWCVVIHLVRLAVARRRMSGSS
ncbi:MAG: hypothetical protein U0610_19090 [bacterium]